MFVHCVLFLHVCMCFLILNLREMMVDAHQNQIQELRESFKQKISQADRWPLKVSKKNTDFIKGYIV